MNKIKRAIGLSLMPVIVPIVLACGNNMYKLRPDWVVYLKDAARDRMEVNLAMDTMLDVEKQKNPNQWFSIVRVQQASLMFCMVLNYEIGIKVLNQETLETILVPDSGIRAEGGFLTRLFAIRDMALA